MKVIKEGEWIGRCLNCKSIYKSKPNELLFLPNGKVCSKIDCRVCESTGTRVLFHETYSNMGKTLLANINKK